MPSCSYTEIFFGYSHRTEAAAEQNLAGLWIRIHFFQIRIQYGSRTLMTKNWKKTSWFFFINNCNVPPGSGSGFRIRIRILDPDPQLCALPKTRRQSALDKYIINKKKNWRICSALKNVSLLLSFFTILFGISLDPPESVKVWRNRHISRRRSHRARI